MRPYDSHTKGPRRKSQKTKKLVGGLLYTYHLRGDLPRILHELSICHDIIYECGISKFVLIGLLMIINLSDNVFFMMTLHFFIEISGSEILYVDF